MLGSATLLNDAICPQQQRRRDREAEPPRRFHVDQEFEALCLLDRQIGRLGAFQDFGYVSRGPPV
jgi:hypothetical protein